MTADQGREAGGAVRLDERSGIMPEAAGLACDGQADNADNRGGELTEHIQGALLARPLATVPAGSQSLTLPFVLGEPQRKQRCTKCHNVLMATDDPDYGHCISCGDQYIGKPLPDPRSLPKQNNRARRGGHAL